MGIVNVTSGIDRLRSYFIKKIENRVLVIMPVIYSINNCHFVGVDIGHN